MPQWVRRQVARRIAKTASLQSGRPLYKYSKGHPTAYQLNHLSHRMAADPTNSFSPHEIKEPCVENLDQMVQEICMLQQLGILQEVVIMEMGLHGIPNHDDQQLAISSYFAAPRGISLTPHALSAKSLSSEILYENPYAKLLDHK